VKATNWIYLDNNATTPLAPEVAELGASLLKHCFANPASAYPPADEARQLLATARRQVAELIGASPQEIVFTSCGTESDVTAIRSALRTAPRGKDKVVISAVEHPAVTQLCNQLLIEGWRVEIVGVGSQGVVDMEAFARALDETTAVVSIMWANNETGVVMPVKELASMAREAGAVFHTDAVQAAGKVKVDMHEAGVDMASLSAHKFHGPKGVGALFVREGLEFYPLLPGGGQEGGRRSGTENTPGIAAMGLAAHIARLQMGAMQRVEQMRAALEEKVKELGGVVHGEKSPRLPNTLCAGFKGVTAVDLVKEMAAEGVCISAGAACHSGAHTPSHVLKAMGVEQQLALGSVRISLSRYTTWGEVERAAVALGRALSRLRKS